MAKIERFEDIEAWQKARVLTREVYQLTRQGLACRDFRYIDQIRSASCSIMSNIAEGYERDGNAEFKQFLYIAKASAGEVRSQLYVGLDVGYFAEADFRRLSSLVTEVVRMIAGFIRYLEQTELKGRKYADRNSD
jgi:four helix bundle protein